MLEIIIADKDRHSREIRELFLEHLRWANGKVKEEFGIDLNDDTMLEADMSDLDRFMPPVGRLLLAYSDSGSAGIACLKPLKPEIGEIKRMYVRPPEPHAGRGIRAPQRVADGSRRYRT